MKCNCGEHIEKTIQSIKKTGEQLNYWRKQNQDEEIREFMGFLRWFLNYDKALLKKQEIWHKATCLDEAHLLIR